MADTSKLIWQIKYVNPDNRMFIEPVDIKYFNYEDVKKAVEYLEVLVEANLCINGVETWFIIELVEVNDNHNKVLLSYRGRE